MADTTSYTHQKERLEEIVVQIRAKDLPLEKSLDLYDEALAIGTRCVEQLEQTDFTVEEVEAATEHPEVSLSGEVSTSDARDVGEQATSDDDTGIVDEVVVDTEGITTEFSASDSSDHDADYSEDDYNEGDYSEDEEEGDYASS